MLKDEYNLAKCRGAIEEKLNWGSSDNWQNQDFELLSERIFQATSVSLSSSTLKRIWGKVKYESSPNPATLNALAQFAGHENWRAFVSKYETELINVANESQVIKPEKKTSYFKLGIGTLIVLGLSAIILWAFLKQPKLLTYEKIQFSSKLVVLGVPNTVVFNYDVSNSNADSVFIQQSWDPERRFKVEKNLHEYTSTYYEPGYFKAKLILNDSIVKEHDLFIESNGWLGIIGRKPMPSYFSEQEIKKNGIIGIDAADLLAREVDLQKEQVPVLFYNVSKQNTVPGDSFHMEAEVRNTFNARNGMCQHSQIALFGTDGIILIPLSIKGCSGELNMFLGMEKIDGKTNDLSGFGVDFRNWINVQCIVHKKNIKILVNQQLVYEGTIKQPIGKVVGTCIAFIGSGEIKKFDMRKL